MILGHPDFSVQPVGVQPCDSSLFFHMHQGKLLMAHKEGQEASLPCWQQVMPLLAEEFEPFELAHAGEQFIFSVSPGHNFVLPETNGLSYVDFNVFRTMDVDAAAIITSCRHLYSWYQNNRFCGKCGAKLEPEQNERALRCTSCGNLLFPVIAPAVIVAVTCKDRILLARNVRYQHYALIAGYVEVGETLEHALRREVMEEVGLPIDNVRYLGDQPWGVSGSHMFAFHASADDTLPLHIQKSELADARWFDRSEVQPLPHKLSIAYELIERFRRGEL